MVKRDGVILEKIPPLRVREDWWVFERPLIMAKKGQVDFLNKIPLF